MGREHLKDSRQNETNSSRSESRVGMKSEKERSISTEAVQLPKKPNFFPKLTNLAWEDVLVIQLSLDPSHEAIDVIWSRHFRRLFELSRI